MKVMTVGPMPPEHAAYALARFSRSADGIGESIRWVKEHQNQDKFFESYYFQYGHASIADLGHLMMVFQDISEVAAIEVEAEPLWDGQAKSTRYQDFSKCQPVVPPEFNSREADLYEEGFENLLKAYKKVHTCVLDHIRKETPKPAEMKQEAYDRTISARAFDNARYLLPLGIPTNVGQVVSIRTLEKQAQRLAASPYKELQGLASDIEAACDRSPDVQWADSTDQLSEKVAPTLARHLKPGAFRELMKDDLLEWYGHAISGEAFPLKTTRTYNNRVDCFKPTGDGSYDILATLLYPHFNSTYEQTFRIVSALTPSQVQEGICAALKNRGLKDELPREFRNAPYVFDIVIDIGAYRDLHRHRRCQQFRQRYTTVHGYEVTDQIKSAGCADIYCEAMNAAHRLHSELPSSGADYILPFGTRMRCLFKMDFAEVEYICKLRSGVKGHFSYREIVWEMLDKFRRHEPKLANFIQATPPWVVDTLTR